MTSHENSTINRLNMRAADTGIFLPAFCSISYLCLPFLLILISGIPSSNNNCDNDSSCQRHSLPPNASNPNNSMIWEQCSIFCIFEKKRINMYVTLFDKKNDHGKLCYRRRYSQLANVYFFSFFKHCFYLWLVVSQQSSTYYTCSLVTHKYTNEIVRMYDLFLLSYFSVKKSLNRSQAIISPKQHNSAL